MDTLGMGCETVSKKVVFRNANLSPDPLHLLIIARFLDVWFDKQKGKKMEDFVL